MMKCNSKYDYKLSGRIFCFFLPDKDMLFLKLDNLDKALLDQEEKGISDILLKLERIAYRLEQSEN